MIYFAQLPTGSIKIGYSEDVEARLNQLEKHYRQPLSLLHTMEGDLDTEREIHQRFTHLRFGNSEQFRPGDDLMTFIGKPLLVSVNVALVEAVGTTRDDVVVKIDKRIAAKARFVASDRNIPAAEYLSDLLRALVDRDFEKATKGGAK